MVYGISPSSDFPTSLSRLLMGRQSKYSVRARMAPRREPASRRGLVLLNARYLWRYGTRFCARHPALLPVEGLSLSVSPTDTRTRCFNI